MKNLLFFLFFLAFTCNAYCQQASPSVIAAAGGFYTGTTLTQSWTMGEVVTETFISPNMILTQGFQQPEGIRVLEGYVTYNNLIASPMNNTTVLLKEGSIIQAQTVTDLTGHYVLDNPPHGNFTLDAICAKPWGGGNALDALLVMKHFVGLSYLTGINEVAADVDASGFINAADALLVMKRFVVLITSFAVGDWVFEHPSLVISGNQNQTVDFKGLCYGDVDGSYTPPAVKTKPEVTLTQKGIQQIGKEMITEIPFRVTQYLEVAAISMMVSYPEELIEIIDVTPPSIPTSAMNREGVFVYNTQGSFFRFAWYSLTPLYVRDNDVLFTLKTRVKNNDFTGSRAISIKMTPESEIGDFNGNVLQNVILAIPILVSEKYGFEVGQNQPNPFSGITQIDYTLPEDALVNLEVKDILGKQVYHQDMGKQEPGTYRIEMNLKQFDNGVYFYTINAKAEKQFYSQTKRMVVTE